MGVAPRRHTEYGQGANETRRHRPDYVLLILTITLALIGLIVVYSISPALAIESGMSGGQYVLRQLIAIGLGLGIFGVTAAVPMSSWHRLYKPLLILAALATLVALVMPVNVQYPAHRWIRVSGFSFQSVELVKFAGMMWLGSFLSWRIRNNLVTDARRTLRPLLFALVGAAIVVAGLQSDLGSFAVIVAMMVAMAFVGGIPMKRIVAAGLIIVALAALLISVTPYRRARLTSFLHPNCVTTGYQACQALIAEGSGGMIGLGLGSSVQAYGYLPEAENDSIFAIYAEKFGFIGVTVLLGLFIAFFTRIKNVAERSPDDFSRLVVVGVLVWLSSQTIINVGAMVGLLPLKGITLPLVSYGGSSVLMVMGALGVVFQASRHTLLYDPVETNELSGGLHDDNSRDGRRVRGAYHPTAGSRP